MGLAATPVDAERAIPARYGDLLHSANVVVDGSDFETPAILGFPEDPADVAEDEHPGATANPDSPNATGSVQDYTTPNPSRDARVRWIDGFQFYPDDCDGGHIIDPCQLGSNADPADANNPAVVGPIQPFIISASDKCSTFGAPQRLRLARAQRKLLAVQSKVLEAEFWSGTKAVSQSWTNNQYLANSSGLTILPIPNSGAALGFVDALAALEQAIADGSAWQRGVIHATPRLVTQWISEHLVRAVPNPPGTLLTELGTIVVAGSGYPGTGPDTHISVGHGHYQWAFVSPIPQIRLGEITYNQTDEDVVAIDRAANDRTIRASRFASVTFSPCFRAAVLANLTTAHSVPGS